MCFAKTEFCDLKHGILMLAKPQDCGILKLNTNTVIKGQIVAELQESHKTTRKQYPIV